MKNVSVKKDMNVKEIKTMVKDMLLENEIIVSDCLVDNSAAATARMGIGIFCGIGLTFNDYASQYKVVATNKRLILVGIADTINLVTGVKVINYDEIKNLTMSKNMRVVRISLNNGTFFELAPLDFIDNKTIIEKSIKTFKYVASSIDAEKVTVKSRAFASNIVLIAAYSAIVLAVVIPTLLKVL